MARKTLQHKSVCQGEKTSVARRRSHCQGAPSTTGVRFKTAPQLGAANAVRPTALCWTDEDAQHLLFQDSEEAHLRCKAQVEVLMERESAVQIWNEIRLWSDEVLEVPCAGFANLPPCPFARMAWLKNNVVVHVTYELGDVVDVKSVMDAKDERLHLFAWVNHWEMTADQFNYWIEEQNQNHFGGLWVSPQRHRKPTDTRVRGSHRGRLRNHPCAILERTGGSLESSKDTVLREVPSRRHEYINRRKEVYDAWNEKACQENAEEGSS